ncbi:MAG: MarC family protein, partial [Candidatus Omnitrophica bacterium]|nr:MarC family protein [Candidatus Omnitrophota bacterium]
VGIIFLLTSIRFTFGGVTGMYDWRGEPEHMAGAVAMPFMIGPATVSASILIGQQMNLAGSLIAITTVLLLTSVIVIYFKYLHDKLEKNHEKLIERYTEVTGRIATLYVGAVSVDMILKGVELWLNK